MAPPLHNLSAQRIVIKITLNECDKGKKTLQFTLTASDEDAILRKHCTSYWEIIAVWIPCGGSEDLKRSVQWVFLSRRSNKQKEVVLKAKCVSMFYCSVFTIIKKALKMSAQMTHLFISTDDVLFEWMFFCSVKSIMRSLYLLTRRSFNCPSNNTIMGCLLYLWH